VTDTAVWVHNFTAGTLLRIDPTTNRVVATISIGHGPGHVALEGGFIWVLSRSDSIVRKIDPQTNKVVASISLPGPNCCLAVSPGAVWVASVGNAWVLRIDPQTDQMVATISLASGPAWMTFGGGSLWGCSFNASTVWQVDPATNNVVKTYDIGSAQHNNCATVATLDNTILVEVLKADNGAQLARIDTATHTLSARVYPLPDNLDNLGMAADAQGIWVFGVNSALYRVDPRTNQVVGKLAITGGAGVAVGQGAVWFATSDGTLLRITPTS
jgi:YVTN family beta-propeller protein